jgi:hypothetical protein
MVGLARFELATTGLGRAVSETGFNVFPCLRLAWSALLGVFGLIRVRVCKGLCKTQATSFQSGNCGRKFNTRTNLLSIFVNNKLEDDCGEAARDLGADSGAPLFPIHERAAAAWQRSDYEFGFHKIMCWLDSHSAAVQALAAVVSVILTVALVLITRKYARLWRTPAGRLRVYFPSYRRSAGFDEAIELSPELRAELEADVIAAYKSAKSEA